MTARFDDETGSTQRAPPALSLPTQTVTAHEVFTVQKAVTAAKLQPCFLRREPCWWSEDENCDRDDWADPASEAPP